MTTRICPECRGHFDVANWICPHCGAQFAPPKPTRPGWVERMAPTYGSLTKGVILVTGIAFTAQLLLARRDGVPPDQVLQLIRMGGQHHQLIQEGQIWRLVTPMLLHGGFMHILFNMFALYQLGPLVEQAFGRSRFLVLYLASGVAGSLASYVFGRYPVSVGASGAICGFLGVMAVWGFRRGGLLGEMVRRQMIQWALLILVFGLMMPGIDNAAHAGGFVGGGALAFLIRPRGLRPDSPVTRRLWGAAAALVLIVAAICVFHAGRFYWETRPQESEPPPVSPRTVQADSPTENRA